MARQAKEPRAWMRAAACDGADSRLFFADEDDHIAVANAKAYCAICPVKAECLDWAFREKEQYGIFGGLTARERRRILRRRRKEAE